MDQLLYFVIIAAILLAAIISVVFFMISIYGIIAMVKRYTELMQLKHIRIQCSENNLYVYEIVNHGRFVLYRKNAIPDSKGIRLGSANSLDNLQKLVDKMCKKVKYTDKTLTETVKNEKY